LQYTPAENDANVGEVCSQQVSRTCGFLVDARESSWLTTIDTSLDLGTAASVVLDQPSQNPTMMSSEDESHEQSGKLPLGGEHVTTIF
jgi:hypothetical protein